MTEPAAPLVDLVDVTVGAPGGPILDRLSLALKRGSVHAVTGPNGAGKTTLLRTLLGEVEFTGSIRMRWRAGRRIGYVPQRLEIDGTLALTVEEFLAASRQRRPVCLGLSAVARAAVAAALAGAGLAGLERRPLAGLSGGELRRVLIAHALDPRPQLLLLDEPADGLDAASRERLEAQVAATRGAGTAVVLVSHDGAMVERLAGSVTRLGGIAA